MADIRIESYFTRGWVIAGTDDILSVNDNNTLTDVLQGGYDNFVIGYKGTDFTYPIDAFRSFLDKPEIFLPYPSSLTVNHFPTFLSVGEESDVEPKLYCTNGDVYQVLDSDIIITSSDINVVSTSEHSVLAVSPGTATITVSVYGVSTKLPIIVLAVDETLFPQVNSLGLYPWN